MTDRYTIKLVGGSWDGHEMTEVEEWSLDRSLPLDEALPGAVFVGDEYTMYSRQGYPNADGVVRYVLYTARDHIE